MTALTKILQGVGGVLSHNTFAGFKMYLGIVFPSHASLYIFVSSSILTECVSKHIAGSPNSQTQELPEPRNKFPRAPPALIVFQRGLHLHRAVFH